MCHSAISLFPSTIWLGYQCTLFYWWLFPWHCINRNNLVKNFALVYCWRTWKAQKLVEFNHFNHACSYWIQPFQSFWILELYNLLNSTNSTNFIFDGSSWENEALSISNFFFKWTIGPNSLSDEKILKIKSNHVLKKLRKNVF